MPRCRSGHLRRRLHIDLHPESSQALARAWTTRQLPAPLVNLASPYRDVTRPVIEHVQAADDVPLHTPGGPLGRR